jgi:hypothetical protein
VLPLSISSILSFPFRSSISCLHLLPRLRCWVWIGFNKISAVYKTINIDYVCGLRSCTCVFQFSARLGSKFSFKVSLNLQRTALCCSNLKGRISLSLNYELMVHWNVKILTKWSVTHVFCNRKGLKSNPTYTRHSSSMALGVDSAPSENEYQEHSWR